jgi:hypothetical protein
MSPELAHRVISLPRSNWVAFGCKADMRTVASSNQDDVNDPPRDMRRAGLLLRKRTLQALRSQPIGDWACQQFRHGGDRNVIRDAALAPAAS